MTEAVSAYASRVLVEASLSTAYRSVQHVWTTLASAFRTLFYALFKPLPSRDLPTILAVADLRIGALAVHDTVSVLSSGTLSALLPGRDLSSMLEVSNG